jgi:ATP-dependent DNA helicase RecG
MDEATLRQLIDGGETATVEFKSSAARPIDIAVRMCGLANNRAGGIIIFGIEDATRAIVGIRKPSLTNDVVLRAARMIKPAVPLSETSVQIWQLDDCDLLTVEVPPNSGRLYQYDGACYVRRGTNTVPLSVEEISSHLHASGLTRWELAVGPAWMTIDDLDLDAVERYLSYRAERSRNRQRLEHAIDLLPALKAVTNDPESGQLRPTNAGVLMFGLDPQLWLPQSEIVCIKYADTLGVRRYIDRKNFRGTLPELIDQASRFLAQYVRVGATIRGFYREDEPEYPHEALREAVVNAVVHRDYSRSGEMVRVFMFSDRVEVRSPGGLPPELSIDDLVGLRATSVPRNEVLAGFLRDIPGYMERVGSGIRFMVTQMRDMGLSDPEFTDHLDFMVTFRNGVHLEAETDLNPRQQIGLQIVRDTGSISTTEYCAATGAPNRTGYRDLQNLVERGLLVVRGKRRGARYYLA